MVGRAVLSALGYQQHFVPARTGKVRVLESRGRGELPPIVLIHGLGSRAVDYFQLVQRLRRHARAVITPDLPGHGKSSAPKDGFDIASCIEGLGDALDAHLREPAIVVGNSLGGFTAIRFAIARPHRVRGLFLASPAGAPSTPRELEELAGKLRMRSRAEAIRFLEIVLHEKPTSPLRHVIALDLLRRYNTPELHMLLRDALSASPLTPDDLSRLDVPTYLLWGRSERLLPPSHLEFFKKHLRATIEEPYGVGHSPYLDELAGTARRILAFARDN